MPGLCYNLLFFKADCKSLLSFSHFQHFLRLSTASIEKPPPNTDFIVDYLINSLGFSAERAILASKRLAHIKSPKKPDSVVSFFRNCGFSDTHIKSLVSLLPTLLSAHVEKTLLPKIRILQEVGLTGPTLAEVLVVNPTLLTVSAENKLLPSLNFLRTLIGNDGDVATVLKRSRWLFNAGDVQKQMQPNISTLQKYGVADERIKKLVVQSPRYLLRKPIWLEHIADRVELEFGIPRGSGMFAYGVDVLCSLSKTTLEKKFQIFASFGWLESDTKTAFRKLPYCLALSEGKIRRGLNFWMKELKYEPSFIARCPKLLMFNLETRIVPRHLVFEALKSKNLIKNLKNPSLHKIVCLQEHRFLEDYVLRYKVEAPELYEIYISSMDRQMKIEDEPFQGLK